MTVKTQIQIIEILNQKGFKVVDGALFSPSHSNSVWFHYPDNEDAMTQQRTELDWDNGNGDKFPITDLLKPHGWFAEAYDSETLFAYQI